VRHRWSGICGASGDDCAHAYDCEERSSVTPVYD
jgi:hypothetical protein